MPPTPPEKHAHSPGGGYFSSSSHATGQSPLSDNNITSPAPLSRSSTLLLTPPISKLPSTQDKGGYFSSTKARSVSRHARTTSPDNNSMPSLSPGLSSGGSIQSSDTGYSLCSYSSGEYLSPPQFQGDDDKPPYRPRSGSSDSLSMMTRKLRRAGTVPNDKKVRVKRRHRRHRCRHNQSKKEDPPEYSCWAQSGCQVAPTAQAGQKHLCSGHAGYLVPRKTRHGNTDTFGRLMPHSMPGPAPPNVTRRWSSVEVGAHQLRLQTPLQCETSRAVRSRGSISRDNSGEFIPENIRHRYRSSSFTRGAIDHGIVEAIREKLTIRKVTTTELERPVVPPLSITLRRASGASGVSGSFIRSPNDQTSSVENSGLTTPLAGTQHVPEDRHPSAAYLITSEDVESITLLIAKNIRQHVHSYDRNSILDDTSSTAQSASNTRTPTISSIGAERPNPFSTNSDTVNVVKMQPTNSRTSDQREYLQVKDSQMTMHRSGSNRSVHELLWKGSRKSSGHFSSTACDTSSESDTFPEVMSEKREMEPVAEKGNAFDPKNASASISEWSWKLPQNDITMVVISSDSDSNEPVSRQERIKARRRPPLRSAASTPKERMAARVRPFPRYAASHEQLQDVVSFPPLSNRKPTSEWISPLPDMEITSPLSSPPFKNSGSLYGIGVDVTTGSSGTTTSKPPFTSWVRSTEASPSQSPGIDFRQDYGFGGLSVDAQMHNDGRRKSSAKPHPKAAPRTGQTFAMGSSIGVHASERRKNSSPRIQRVRTIDNIHKGERDEPASRWRPPSVCPPRLSPSQLSLSPVEAEESREQRLEDRVPEMMTRLHRLRSGFTDRISLVEATTPPLPKSDCAGIYGTITGTLRRSIGASCQGNAPTHDCDDCAKEPRNPSVDWIG
ncbi:hypothetical protein BKA64DRAFT_727605 [Cadophora sp. MPI-SDFR-AT-0126]|nr:hypothetical protein BKA64DRAFT_727605 [Leotiomycetes sp. MPI-SDFR-AT-0126]